MYNDAFVMHETLLPLDFTFFKDCYNCYHANANGDNGDDDSATAELSAELTSSNAYIVMYFALLDNYKYRTLNLANGSFVKDEYHLK